MKGSLRLRKPSSELTLITVRIVVIYLVVGTLWVLGSDLGLSFFLRDNVISLLDSIGGWVFVVASSLLLYILIRWGMGIITRDTAARVSAEDTLRRRNAELDALYETTLGLVNRLDPDSLLEAIVSRAASLAGTDHTYFHSVEAGEAGEPQLILRAAVGRFADHIGYTLHRGEGVGGHVWDTGRIFSVDDYHTWSQRRPDLDWMGIRALVGIPLFAHDQIVSVIGLGYFEEGRTVDSEDIALLERFGKLASLILENARLYADAQQELVERRQAETALIASEARYRMLMEHAEEQAAHQTQLLSQLLTAQEAERRRLSIELHDGPLQSLGVSLLSIDRIIRRHERHEYELAAEELQDARETITGIVADVRAVLSDLSLDILTSYGLDAALRDHIDRFSEVTGINVRLDYPIEERLPAYVELLMYRLAQESLANVRKHSGATYVDVSLKLEESRLTMTISDNGKGFDPTRSETRHRAGERIGLPSMRQRIRDAHGDMTIQSAPGQGTTLTFWCPIPPSHNLEPAEASDRASS